ncbi:glycosyltransferase [Candidatus Woesebacteria bacterium]|nr:glycosyltransferase [Candidatus Woesebacteria bacterium]
MKICFFSPYLPDSFGGGEKHLFDVAGVLAEKHTVFIAISNASLDESSLKNIQHKYERFYGKSLSKFTFIPTPLFTAASALQKLKWTAQFDALYYVTDGSLFFSAAKQNYLHIQVPFSQPLSFIQNIKLGTWQHINVNSHFTQHVMQQSWKIQHSTVLYPLIEEKAQEKTSQKGKYILGVGRFFTGLHTKRQDILIEIFKQFISQYPKESEGWQLILAGSAEDERYIELLKEKARDLPIQFAINISRAELDSWYQKARFFIHATGYEVDEQKHPEQVEHFGITTVEALGAGVVPLVVGKGGQKEILVGELAELTWDTTSACVEKLLTLILDEKKYTQLQELGLSRAADFGSERFHKEVKMIFNV